MNYILDNEGKSRLKLFIYLIGLLKVASISKGLLKFIFSLFRRQNNFVKRYGQNTYALITGSSDGIGKQFAIELAKQGMGVVLVARNEQKLNAVKQEIQQKCPKANIKIFVANFQNALEPNFFQNLFQQVQDLEISMVINNVGIDYFSHFDQIQEHVILDLIKINILSTVMICRHFLPLFAQKYQQTKVKSAILNVGSFAGVLPCVYFHVYGATKAFVNLFTRTIASEYPQIDIMCLNPSEVSTPMIGNRPTDIMTISSNACAKWALKDLGKEEISAGHWNHKIQTGLYLNIPYCIYNYILKNFISPEWFKEREKFQK